MWKRVSLIGICVVCIAAVVVLHAKTKPAYAVPFIILGFASWYIYWSREHPLLRVQGRVTRIALVPNRFRDGECHLMLEGQQKVFVAFRYAYGDLPLIRVGDAVVLTYVHSRSSYVRVSAIWCRNLNEPITANMPHGETIRGKITRIGPAFEREAATKCLMRISGQERSFMVSDWVYAKVMLLQEGDEVELTCGVSSGREIWAKTFSCAALDSYGKPSAAQEA